ncbi:hypothetical protein FRC17_003606 [Serendipita sp. 399]|nr:hypothetical protein FRC17_003606 [Serendipita sp. 399]
MTAVIAGSVIGVAIVILALLLFWIWRRKRYKVVEETLPFEEPYPIPRDPKVSEILFGVIQLPMSEVSLSPSDLQLPPGAFSPKMVGLPVSRRPFTPIDHPSAAASAEPLINTSPSNGQNANSNPSNLEARPIEIDGLVPPPGSADNNNDYAPPLPRQSMSARMLAQALAPNLSENDLDRLAESIVARMQVTTVPPAEHGDVSHLGRLGSEVGSPEARGEPPPAWRSSWGSTGQPVAPLRRPDSVDPTRV